MDLNYIWDYLYYIVLNLALLRFLTFRLKRKYLWIWGIIILECIGYTLINMQTRTLGIIFTFGSYIIGTLVFYKEPIRQKMFIGIFILSCNMLTPVIGFFTSFGIYNLAVHTKFGGLISPYLVVEYISPILFFIEVCLIQFFIYKISKYEIIKGLSKDKKIRIYMLIIILIGIGIEVIPYFLQGYNLVSRPDIGAFWSIIVLLLLIIIIIMGVLIIINYQKKEVINKKNELNTKLNVLENHIENSTEIIEKKNIVLHDVKSHMSVIKSLVALGDEEEILNYINDLNDGILQIYENKVSGNLVVDSILIEKRKMCLEKDIKFNIECTVPKVIKIKYFDLSTILCNLIDNAIEENLRCAENTEKYIDISLKVVEGAFLIKIDNLSREKEALDSKVFKSSKQGNHGYGIKNIKTIVGKYDGVIKFSNENYKFTAMAYLSCLSE